MAAPPSRAAVDSARSRSRPVTATRAPACVSAAAIANPRPLVPPVTRPRTPLRSVFAGATPDMGASTSIHPRVGIGARSKSRVSRLEDVYRPRACPSQSGSTNGVAMTRRSLEQRCRETLEGSWIVGERDGVAFAYTRPSPGRYRWQWYWDSCFAAISWRHFEPARSRAELETLLAAARPDGFIGHTIFWVHPVSGPRELFYNVIHPDDVMTATIQPP